MKRIIFILLATAAIFTANIFACIASLSDTESLGRELSTDGAGVYAIRTTNTSSQLIKIENGTITELYDENRGGSLIPLFSDSTRHTEFVDTLLGEGELFAVRETIDGLSGNIVKREIVRFTLPLNMTEAGETIYTETGILNACTDLSMYEGAFMLTTLGADGSAAYIQKITGSGTNYTVETTTEKRASFDNLMFRASVINGKLYAVTKNSDIIFFEGVNLRLLHKSEIGDAIFCIAPYDEGIAYSDITTAGIYTNEFGSDEVAFIKADNITSAVGLTAASKTSFTALLSENGTAVLATVSDGVAKTYNALNTSASVLIFASFLRALPWFAGFVAVYLLGRLTVFIYKRSRSVSVKAGILSVPVSVVVFAAVFTLCTAAAGDAVYEISAKNLLEKQDAIFESVKKQNLEINTIEYFGKGPFYRAAEKYITNSTDGLENELYYLNGKTLFTAVSEKLPFAYPAKAVCSAEVFDITNSALGGSPVTVVSSDGFNVYAARMAVSDTDTMVLLSRLSVCENRLALMEKIKYIAVVSAAAAVVSVLFAFLIFTRMCAPLKSLKNNVRKVASGECKTRVRKRSFDELACIGRELNRLNSDYREAIIKNNTISLSYKRFMPKKLNDLVGRDTEAEIEVGDNRRFMATIAVNTLANRAEIRRKLRDEELVEFVNSYFNVQHEKLGEYGGLLVSNDFGLSSSRWLFAESDDAAAASANLIRRLDDVTVTEGIKASETVILHRTSVLCGVAGTEDRAVPFVSFAEADFLAELSMKLSETGAKLVITKEQLDSSENSYTTRKIGYADVPNTKKRLELYEIMDIYPAEIRRKRSENTAVFSRALELYYGGDYYMARNLFSTVLRTSGDDGVARWYIFACEKLMNNGTKKEQLGLFEAETTV